MRWQKKKKISRIFIRKTKVLVTRIAMLLLISMIVLSASMLSSEIALANQKEDELNRQVEKFKYAQIIKGCQYAFAEKALENNGFIPMKSIYEGATNGIFGGSITGSKGGPLMAGPGIPDGSNELTVSRMACDINTMAQALGKGSYLTDYLKNNVINRNNLTDLIHVAGKKEQNADEIRSRINSGDLNSLEIQAKILADASKSFPADEFKLDAAAEFVLYSKIANDYCIEGGFKKSADGGGNITWPVLSDDKKSYTVEHGYIDYKTFEHKSAPIFGQTLSKGSEPTENLNVIVVPRNSLGRNNNTDMTCKEVVKRASERADAYAKAMNDYLAQHPDEQADGQQNDTDKDECAAELNGYGTLICSGQNLFITISDILYGMIADTLASQSDLTKVDGVRQKWNSFLNIANIVLIIAFLVVIYSTATSTGGLSNYDIKKLLPRIIILAIAINLSFYICMALVDLSSILGRGIISILIEQESGPQLLKNAQETAKTVVNIAPELKTVALVAIAAVLVVLIGAPVILALLTIVFALAVRGVALMLLVIISPIAFAIYLFNHQGMSKVFNMWLENFIKLLLVYPLFMLVWGGSRLVSGLTSNSSSIMPPALPLLIEVACFVAPALSILPLFKMSGSILGKATLAAAGNQAAQKFAHKAGGMATGARDKIGRAAAGAARTAAGAAAGAAGAAAGKMAGAVQNARGGASTGNIANQLDDQAMNSARNKVDKYSASDRHDAFTTGQINGQTLKPYEMRAVIEKELPNASSTDVKQSMHAVNNEAQRLKKNGQNADADKLLRTFVTTASANKNSQMGSKSLNDFANSGGWSMGQFEAKYADAVADYATNEMTAQDIAGTDAANLAQMRQTLQYSADSGGSEAAADAGMRSMARQSNIALSDPSLTSKMNAQTASELRDNTLLRSTAGEKLANTHKIPNIYHDYNAGGGSSTLATLHAKKMMRHADFGKLDAIDQSRLRAIAGASVHMTPGAPATPVAIASWDRRA